MSPINRARQPGIARVDARILTELDWLLDMDEAAPRGVVKPLADQLADYHRDLDLDHERDWVDGVHSWLSVREVNAVQRLRGWNRLRHGTVTVDAAALAEVRNVLDRLTLAGIGDCDDHLSDCAYDYTPEQIEELRRTIETGEACYHCATCKAIVMRDRIDVLLDAQGFDGGSGYNAYGRPEPGDDPERVWRDKVLARPAAVAA